MAPINDSPAGELRSPAGIHFDPNTGYVLVQLEKEAYGFKDQPVRYQGRTFQPKNELHITIVSRDAADALKRYLSNHSEEIRRVQAMVDSTDWSYYQQEAYFLIQERTGVETIIQMVDVPALPGFYSRLNQILQNEFPLPPTHVTLYTRGTNMGIGIPTQVVFDRLVKGRLHWNEIIPLQERQRD